MNYQNTSLTEDKCLFLFRTEESDFTPCCDESERGVQAAAQYSPAGNATRLSVTWKNTSDAQLVCQFEIRVKTNFVFSHYVIPAVSYNGNGWGQGREPKGLVFHGEPWVFDHRRTSIPACTISENKDRFFAMFAANDTLRSLNASCSMVPCEDGTMIHRLLYPCIEKPVTYRGRDRFDKAHEAYITLAPGESFATAAYLMAGIPETENFAASQVQDAALDLLTSPFPPKYTPEEVQFLCCEFAKRLLIERDGRKRICTGKSFDPDAGAYVFAERYEFGWCGQNGLYARLFLQRGFETHDQTLIDLGIELLDVWSEGVGSSGLIYTNYDGSLKSKPTADTCNLSYAVLEYAKAYRFLKERGTEKENWLITAERIADFLIDRFDPQNGFGKLWDVDTGVCIDSGGTIGAFMIPALCALYETTKQVRFLSAAKKACRLYRDRDLKFFMCTAGALDTCCIDKETSGPLLAGALALYALEKEEEWLACAKLAGWYFCSWMFHHDTVPVPGSDFERYGYRTLGGTSVSAQHHHLDPWGALIVPHLLLLWDCTGDSHWKQRAQLIWANAIQNIAPKEGKEFHGHMRLPGDQNEACFHCAWGGDLAPGNINEWLVSWPQAFCWNTAVFLSDRRSGDGSLIEGK